MTRRFLTVSSPRSMVAFAALTLCGAQAAFAQSSGRIELHANRNVTAASIGLPDYPGARSYQKASNDSTADLGFTFGDFHFRLLVSKVDSPAPTHRGITRSRAANRAHPTSCAAVLHVSSG